jgi:electron transfer flavoprotein alpha subunit
MTAVLVYSERPDVALELLSCARRLAAETGASVSGAVIGASEADVSATRLQGYCDVLYMVGPDDDIEFQYDTYGAAIVAAASAAEAELVLIGSTRRGKALAPRVAQSLGAACSTDVREVSRTNERLVISRLALGGNTVRREEITAPQAVLAVVPGVYEQSGSGDGQTEVVTLPRPAPSRAAIVAAESKAKGAVNIEDADRLICIGRGIGSKDDIPMIEALADKLGAEIAATRPLAYEYKWMPEDRMVGISGKSVAPELYVVIGSSGQIQHTVSVRDSKIIVAINKDRNAPIFEMTDYGIVGDLYDLVPRLTEAL